VGVRAKCVQANSCTNGASFGLLKAILSVFPSFFMFQLTDEEWTILRSQIVTFSKDSRKYKPYALNNLIEKPKKTRKIGFHADDGYAV